MCGCLKNSFDSQTAPFNTVNVPQYHHFRHVSYKWSQLMHFQGFPAEEHNPRMPSDAIFTYMANLSDQNFGQEGEDTNFPISHRRFVSVTPGTHGAKSRLRKRTAGKNTMAISGARYDPHTGQLQLFTAWRWHTDMHHVFCPCQQVSAHAWLELHRNAKRAQELLRGQQ